MVVEAAQFSILSERLAAWDVESLTGGVCALQRLDEEYLEDHDTSQLKGVVVAVGKGVTQHEGLSCYVAALKACLLCFVWGGIRDSGAPLLYVQGYEGVLAARGCGDIVIHVCPIHLQALGVKGSCYRPMISQGPKTTFVAQVVVSAWSIWHARNETIFKGSHVYVENTWKSTAALVSQWGRGIAGVRGAYYQGGHYYIHVVGTCRMFLGHP
ncbi:hypothetical protein QJS10_CPA06g00976 [Acorus calamus]|nr:hypothetical protein QJS10_CPA06g00976 [Acorus calamus]